MMMMMELAKATAMVDVYVVAPNNRVPGDGGGPAMPETKPGAPPPPEPTRPQTPAQRHFTMANLACYPAINIPNGFDGDGNPTNVTFFARPFGEMELLALAKKYQDAAGFHLKRPTTLDT
jgi:Asp-tRNA(Asn)/Glu-tRNA(Gln) amidotransferase A subunit family amidase